MELVTASLELAKEAVTEVTKEVVKATEELAEFGRVGNDIAAKQISFGRLGIGDCENQINFGSLANGAFKADTRYLNWKDGIDVGEITPTYISELANEIAAIFGKDNIKVTSKSGYNNAGMLSERKWGRLFYDPEFLQKNGNEYGMDTILSTLSHEVGHRVVYNLDLEKELTAYENEACADYLAGLTTRLCKLNKNHQLSWYDDGSAISLDDVHPGKLVRKTVFNRGFDRIDSGKEAAILKTFEVFSPYDLEGIYQDAHMLKSILYQDVIAPLRTGEITKV